MAAAPTTKLPFNTVRHAWWAMEHDNYACKGHAATRADQMSYRIGPTQRPIRLAQELHGPPDRCPVGPSVPPVTSPVTDGRQVSQCSTGADLMGHRIGPT